MLLLESMPLTVQQRTSFADVFDSGVLMLLSLLVQVRE
jgi:hypothetical protein